MMCIEYPIKIKSKKFDRSRCYKSLDNTLLKHPCTILYGKCMMGLYHKSHQSPLMNNPPEFDRNAHSLCIGTHPNLTPIKPAFPLGLYDKTYRESNALTKSFRIFDRTQSLVSIIHTHINICMYIYEEIIKKNMHI